jgi:hypothetical protein
VSKRKRTSNHSIISGIFYLAGLLVLQWIVHHQQLALLFTQKPQLILPYLIQTVGIFWLVIGGIGIIAVLWFLVPVAAPSSEILRGARIISVRKLRVHLKREAKPHYAPQLEVAGVPIPAQYENRGFFVVGSPGSGKTQIICQLVAQIRQRADFRGIVFDRSGELLEKFYDPSRDLIFNPHDDRSVNWKHTDEPIQMETIAAGLIPKESTREPFFSDAGRAVMAELFRQTQSSAEVLEMLQSDVDPLRNLLSGTLAARYLGEERVATSVLSTATNYCQFYRSLMHLQSKTLSFYRWGASNNARWIFITVHEDDAELFKQS